jgi:hypothetical protein
MFSIATLDGVGRLADEMGSATGGGAILFLVLFVVVTSPPCPPCHRGYFIFISCPLRHSACRQWADACSPCSS